MGNEQSKNTKGEEVATDDLSGVLQVIDDDEEAPPLDVGFLEISEDDLSPQQRKMLHERGAHGGGNITAQEALDIAGASELEHAKVKIGIVGDAGAGKSTFINSFRGLSPGDVGAAKVSAIGHATSESKSYDVPGQAVVLIDFPGVLFKPPGEEASSRHMARDDIFNISSYLDLHEEKMQECDFFLVFLTNRPSNNVVWIAKEARKMGKRLLFVRSQADIDIAKARLDNPKDFPKNIDKKISERRVMNKFKQSGKETLEALGYSKVDVGDIFIICGLKDHVARGDYDMAALRVAMLDSLSTYKQRVLIKSIQDFSIDTLMKKGEVMRKIVWGVAAGASAISAVPLPGLGVAVDMAAVFVAYKYIQRSFSIDDASLEQLASICNKSALALKRFRNRKSTLWNAIKNSSGPLALRTLVAAASSSAIVASLAITSITVKIALPIIGGVIAAPASFALIVFLVRKFIDETEKCATELFKFAFSNDMGPAYIGIIGDGNAGEATFIDHLGKLLHDDDEGATNKPIAEAKFHKTLDNVEIVELPPPHTTKKLFKRTVTFDEEAYFMSFADDMNACSVLLVFIAKSVSEGLFTIARKAKEMELKVLFIRTCLDDDELHIDSIRKEVHEDLKTHLDHIAETDIFIVNTLYDNMVQDKWHLGSLRAAILHAMDQFDMTDRNLMQMQRGNTFALKEDTSSKTGEDVVRALYGSARTMKPHYKAAIISVDLEQVLDTILSRLDETDVRLLMRVWSARTSKQERPVTVVSADIMKDVMKSEYITTGDLGMLQLQKDMLAAGISFPAVVQDIPGVPEEWKYTKTKEAAVGPMGGEVEIPGFVKLIVPPLVLQQDTIITFSTVDVAAILRDPESINWISGYPWCLSEDACPRELLDQVLFSPAFDVDLHGALLIGPVEVQTWRPLGSGEMECLLLKHHDAEGWTDITASTDHQKYPHKISISLQTFSPVVTGWAPVDAVIAVGQRMVDALSSRTLDCQFASYIHPSPEDVQFHVVCSDKRTETFEYFPGFKKCGGNAAMFDLFHGDVLEVTADVRGRQGSNSEQMVLNSKHCCDKNGQNIQLLLDRLNGHPVKGNVTVKKVPLNQTACQFIFKEEGDIFQIGHYNRGSKTEESDSTQSTPTKLAETRSVRQNLARSIVAGDGKREDGLFAETHQPQAGPGAIKTDSIAGGSGSKPVVLLVNDEYGNPHDDVSIIHRQMAGFLASKGAKVYSTVLGATKDDEDDAAADGVQLIFPTTFKGDKRKPNLDWLTWDHQTRYPNLPSDVGFIVGHVNVTSRAARRIKEHSLPGAKLVQVTHLMPEETSHYQGDEKVMRIGEENDSILDDLRDADVIFSVGPLVYDYYKHQTKQLQLQHHEFLPKPSDIFSKMQVNYVNTKTKVVLSIGRIKGAESLKGYDIGAKTMGIVIEQLPNTKWRACDVSPEDFAESKKVIQANVEKGKINFTPLKNTTQNELSREIQQAHVVLMLSRAEPFGLAGLEAIAAGVPVLVSNKSGLALFLKTQDPEFDRWIVEIPDDDNEAAKTLAKRIIKILTDGSREFQAARTLKEKLLASKYWDESHSKFLEVLLIGSKPDQTTTLGAAADLPTEDTEERELRLRTIDEFVTEPTAGSSEVLAVNSAFIISDQEDDLVISKQDVARLKMEIQTQLNDLQQQEFDMSPDFVSEKSRVLKEMAWVQAVDAMDVNQGPCLLVETPVKIAMARELCKQAQKCFGFDEDSLTKLAAISGTDVQDLKIFVQRNLPMCTKLLSEDTDPAPPDNIRTLASLLSKNSSTLLTLGLANWSFTTTIPVVGFGGKALNVVAYFLCRMIDEQAECAKDLHNFAFNK